MLGKQTRRRPGTNTGALVKGQEMMLRRDHLQPGDCVSLDQYESSIPGHLPHTYGKEKKDNQYNGGTLFINHASSMVFIQHQVSLHTGETLQAKHKFEQLARAHGVTIKSYHADNSPFGNADFVCSIEDNGQAIQFSGVGAHHQNGVTECTIKTISSWARTMLLHTTIHWPEQNHLTLWAYAFEHAIFLWNNLPGCTSGIAPLELFTGVSLASFAYLQRSHVWGCPVYVLDPKLQDGKKLPKWQARAHWGQYLGVSPDHSSTIGRILNLQSGFISPNIMLFMMISSLQFPMLNLVAHSSLPLMALFGVSSLLLATNLSYLMMKMIPFLTFTLTGLLMLNFVLISVTIPQVVSTHPRLSRSLFLWCRLRLPGGHLINLHNLTHFYRCLGYVLVVLNLSVPKIIIS